MCLILMHITSNQSGKSEIGWEHNVQGVTFPNYTIVSQYPQGKLPALFWHITPRSYQ